MLFLDTEVYKNYFLCKTLDSETGEYTEFEMYEDRPLNVYGLAEHLSFETLVTFNGNNYDMIILSAALGGKDNAKLKQISDDIIHNNLTGWKAMEKHGAHDMSRFDHIDLIEVAPGIAGLKAYGARMHAPKLQDLPIEPEALITPEQRPLLRSYCGNDLDTTEMLFNALRKQITLREQMSEEYGLDLRSKSDAQIAEAVIRSRVNAIKGVNVQRPVFRENTYRYTRPYFIIPQSDVMKEVVERVVNAEYRVDGSGKMVMPPELNGYEVKIGKGVYRMGIGGLHSSEANRAVEADNEYTILDRDVASYYPSIILNMELAPAHMGKDFLRVYKDIVDRRLEAKRTGDKVVADALKICVNGSFGKLGSRYSVLYAPQLMITVTLTGQLALLMLIDRLEAEGFEVISANTDGVTTKVKRSRRDEFEAIISDWEWATDFVTEEVEYLGLYSKSVNSYVALKAGGGVKTKGDLAFPSLQKNPANVIVIEAVCAFLEHGTPIDKTIKACTDLKKFLSVRSVKGGGLDQQGNYLGKTVRWYMAKGVSGSLTYKSNGYTVARSEGGKPVMNLPDTFPDDINYQWYFNEANKVLDELGLKGE